MILLMILPTADCLDFFQGQVQSEYHHRLVQVQQSECTKQKWQPDQQYEHTYLLDRVRGGRDRTAST